MALQMNVKSPYSYLNGMVPVIDVEYIQQCMLHSST